MVDARNRFVQWCHEQRGEAEQALRWYEEGVMQFRSNNADIVEEQKASLRRVIYEMTRMIQRIEDDSEL